MKLHGQTWVQCLRLVLGLALLNNIDITLEIWLHPSYLKLDLVVLYRRQVPGS